MKLGIRSSSLAFLLCAMGLLPAAGALAQHGGATPADGTLPAEGDMSVTLAWDANPAAENIQGYKIHSTKVGVNGVRIVQVGNQTVAAVDKLEPDTEYTFTLTAFNARGESEHSNMVRYRTPPRKANEPRPAMISNLRMMTAADGSSEGVAMDFKGGALGKTYQLQVSTDLKNWTTVDAVTFQSEGEVINFQMDWPLGQRPPAQFYRVAWQE